MKLSPADRELLKLRGLALFQLGRAADALPFLESGNDTANSNAGKLSYVLAPLLHGLRRYDYARNALASQFGFPHDSAPAHLVLARLLLRRSYVPTAEIEAHSALTNDPGIPCANLLLGEATLSREDLPGAIAFFEAE